MSGQPPVTTGPFTYRGVLQIGGPGYATGDIVTVDPNVWYEMVFTRARSAGGW